MAINLRQTKWVIALCLMAVGVGIIVASTLPNATSYYVTVDELLAKPEVLRDKKLKVAGQVVMGSIDKSEQDLTWKFTIAHAEQMLHVSYRGPMPDTFKDHAEVVLTGTWDGSDSFQATHVLAKCASRYEAKLQPSYL